MGRKRDTAVQSVPETGVPASTPCDDLMSLYGNSFLTEMMCGAESAAPQEAGPEAAGPGLGTYTTVAAAADALSTTPNRNLTNPR